ncbi:MAG TPA: lysophospholipase [Paenibacillus sp.]|uniref:GDSL-type esterase/lipase family protein n=1 Tax=Paenibacillus TaxID=44249 RepID=UPI000B9FFD54|nr:MULTISPECIES: GDSL-type esterase/lipase family protein [Paenibacillus]OZQ73337.1 lysophospholipase [Paenibacillus taichungensis]HBU82145.1 lysophospholipase [Paenibacillus sp.]
MYKKVISTLFIGSIALALAACGNGQNTQSKAPMAEVNETAPLEKSNNTSYKTIFQHSVFLGDSITEALSFYDILDEFNVMAGAGTTTELALEAGYVDKLAERNPQHAFIMLGSDDILLPPQITDNPKEYSLKFYAKLVDSIKEKLPKATITVLPVTPVTPEAEKVEQRYKNINDYNQGLKELASKKKVGFVDLSSIFADSQDLYSSDGVHFKSEFYTRMLDLLKDQVK